MKTLLKTAAVAACAFAASGPALAQTSDTANSSANIVQSLTITKNTDLLFGTLQRPAPGAADSTVSISDSSDTINPGATAIAVSGTTSRAQFTINGEGAEVVDVTIPANFVLDGPGTGAQDLTVTLDPSLAGSGTAYTATISGTAGTAGNNVFHVGGSFTLADDTPVGAYTGSFQVTVAYQ